MLVAFGLISTYLELALKYLHVVQMGMVQLLCGTVPLVSKQWGLSRKVPTSVEYNVQLNISVIKGLYGNIIPSTAPNHPMANNALIFFSTNTMKIQNMQGTVSDFWWLMIGMYSGD